MTASLTRKADLWEEALSTDILKGDLAWYYAQASELKDPEKRRRVEESIERISRLLGV